MTEGTGWTDAELVQLRLEGLNRLTHLLSGEATERDAAEFVAWRMQSRVHEEAFRSAVKLRRLVRVAEGIEAPGTLGPNASADGGKVIPLAAAAHKQLSRRAFIGGAMAASFAGGLLVLGRSMDLVPSPSELGADYRTGTGERRLVQLADGATVELNTRTSIDLRHDLSMPAVELISGEALMTSPASGETALVAANGTSIGRSAHFNARRNGDEVCVTCLAGQVEVSWSGERRVLGAHDQVRYNGEGIAPVLRGVDTVAVTAWKAGTLIFRNMPMREVIEEINRYRPGRVLLANRQLAGRSLSGTYYVNRLDEFFSQAELGLGAKVTRLPGNVVILS